MAFSRESFLGLVGQQSYQFGTGTGNDTNGLKFLSSAHLTVTVAGISVAFTVAAGHGSFTITGATIAGGETILVSRTTPATEEGRLVDFEDLSHVRQSDLDTSSLQLLYLAQESLDVVSAAECLELGISGHWDGENRRITNLASGVAGTDAVNKSQLDAVSVAAGNLPVVGVSDNDKSLWVVAGAWAIRTPAQARTHLALGTAALLNAGTAAGNVVQLDGSARYPAVDGRNIDLALNAVQTAINLRYRSTVGIVVQGTEATPATDATATWSETSGSRLTPGTLTDLDNSSDVVIDNGAKKVTLSAGTWEVQWSLRAYNLNTTAGNDQDLRVKLTDDVDGPSQVVYDADYDKTTIEAAGGSNKQFWSLGNTLLLKLPSGGAVVIRAVNEDGADIRIPSVRMSFRKVSTAT